MPHVAPDSGELINSGITPFISPGFPGGRNCAQSLQEHRGYCREETTAKRTVLFCAEHSDLFTNELVSGHHFDVETGEISPLFRAATICIPGVTPGMVSLRR